MRRIGEQAGVLRFELLAVLRGKKGRAKSIAIKGKQQKRASAPDKNEAKGPEFLTLGFLNQEPKCFA